MKRTGPVVASCLLALVATATAFSAQGVQTRQQPLSVTFPGIGGNLFEPGQEVVVTWKLEGAEVRDLELNPWAECELLFSTDAGRTWSRITPQLSVTKKNYTWVVPDTPTRSAKLGLQVGVAGEGEFYLLPSKRFAIVETADAPGVRLLGGAPREIPAGSRLDLRWVSTVPDVLRYEVAISSDRGAHFFRVGTTEGVEYSFSVPADYEGPLTVQIAALRPAGAPVRSPLDAASTYFVRRAGD